MIKRIRSNKKLLVCIALVLLVTCAYSRVYRFDFTSFDDPDYVYNNPHVCAGLTWPGIVWAFTTGFASNWHPLTWISHMLDCQLFGLNPGAHHLTSVGIHAINTILLFLVLSAITGSVWRSAFIAALFALHPIQVESVAWISERKNVLSTLFWLLTMWAYFRYRKQPGVGRYALVIFIFALGLMAKPMLVTLPLVLLLLDYWPIGSVEKWSLKGNLLNKVPLLMLAAVSSWITIVMQKNGGMTRMLDDFPIGQRLANAVVSYVAYLAKMFWPRGLCMMYPHPKDTLPVWLVIACAMLLLLMTWLVYHLRRSRPYLIVGWLWYLVTLVPVIGIVQVGPQAMADRYAYVPLIGIFLMIGWGIPDVLKKMLWVNRRLLAMPAAIALVILMVCTFVQTGYWRNTGVMYSRAIAATNDHPVVRYCYAGALLDEGKIDDAVRILRGALANHRCRKETHYLLGSIYARQGRLGDAIVQDKAALGIDPNFALAQNNLGVVLARSGDIAGAMEHISKAIRLKPDYADAHHSFGVLLMRQGKIDAAIREWKQALEIDPQLGDTRLKLADALCEKGDYTGAWREVEAARKSGFTPDPKFVDYLRGKMRSR